MQGPEKLREIVQTLLADGVKDLSDDQSPSFHLQTDATVPIGQMAVKVEVGVGVEDGDIKPTFQAKLTDLLPVDLIAATPDESTERAREKRAVYSGGIGQGKKAQARSYGAGKHGRGHRGMAAGFREPGA